MKRLFLLPFLVVALHAQPAFYQPDGWALGTEFPGTPKASEKRGKMPQGELVELRAYFEKGGEVYAVERVLYPIPLPPEKHDVGYEGGKRGMLRANPGVIKSEEKISICGYEGRRYLVERKNGARLTDHRVVIVGNEVYQFAYERFTKDEASPASEAFFSKIAEKKG
ncbi:MAG TPA: hypothetical protein VIM71_09045 [Lacunisphaera sp.]